MIQKQKIKIYLLLFILSSLFFVPAQSQTSEPEITLTWSTDTYIPFGYSGKALPVQDSLIRVAATINSQSVSPESLNYSWYLDDFLRKDQFGLGKQVFEFQAAKSAGQIHQVKVLIKNKEETISFEKTIKIKIISPQIHLTDPISQIEANQEAIFKAIPYYFNIKNIDELDYNWILGDKKPQFIDSQNPNIFTLRVGQVAETIVQTLKLSVNSKNNPKQKAETSLKITFIP